MMASSDAFEGRFGNTCRLCLKQEGIMSSLFEATSPEDDSMFLVQKIERDDGLPEWICLSCQQQVEKLYNFRILVEISDRTLRSCLQSSQTSFQDGKIKLESLNNENVIEYKEFSMDSNMLDSDVDLSQVNAIFVQTEDGIQVWKICKVSGQEDEEGEEISGVVEENLGGSNAPECPKEVSDSEIDDLQGIQRFLKKEKMNVEDLQTQVKQIFTCQYCDSLFLTSDDLVEHLEIHEQETENAECNDTNNDMSCQLCLKPFQSLSELKVHISEHFLNGRTKSESNAQQDLNENNTSHPTLIAVDSIRENEITDDNEARNRLFICIDCHEVFPQEEDFLFHRNKHLTTSGKAFKCKYCAKLFSRISSKHYHEQTHSGGKKYICVVCGKCFSKKTELKYHEGTHVNTPSICTVCNKHFLNVQSFKMHMKRHILGSRYNCQTCGKSYYTNAELSRHLQKHSGKRRYPCHLCEMSFLSQPELNRHLKYHNGEKKFKCKICAKSYFESGHLKVHQRVHTGEKPFVCTVCNKAFITKSKLVRHAKIHSKEQIIVCDIFPIQEKEGETVPIFSNIGT
ncbi:gastrula zinc finger protein XlCGF57.1 isoform X2 [Cephus cinctus]|uniref:Gastrula zinc finger protein XlCGF57.1 isoform X2 n=1 Tax=Cephus cinctus TaxID=211228 RepID=A0AAJ7RIH7_CEPCN|nr:gastrula zinc finger protein XlCGF57.1 isoform X2 [Cephus cinctus]